MLIWEILGQAYLFASYISLPAPLSWVIGFNLCLLTAQESVFFLNSVCLG